MKKLTVVFLSDPGHGWVKIAREKVARLGILNRVSPYSYQHGKWVFLEEDCDAALLVERCKELGINFKVKSKKQSNKQSKVRSYPRFQLSAEEAGVTVNQVGA